MYSIEEKSDLLYIYRKCMVSNKEYEVIVNKNDFDNWKQGTLIQDAMPYLTAEQREFVRINLTPDEYDEIFCFEID